MAEPRVPALVCEALSAGWGETQVVSELSFLLPRGEILVVLGRNGVGKSTLLSAIIGRARTRAGSILLAGQPIEGLPVYERVKRGVGFVPQEREIFPSLTVEENLRIAAQSGAGGRMDWTFERVIDLFPRLGERLKNGGNQLSGGEQQMLSIGRALMSNPALLLLDEPMEGLAPVIIEQLSDALHRLKTAGDLAILLVEQHVEIALGFSSRVIVLDRGRTVYDNSSGEHPADRVRIDDAVGLSHEPHS